MHPSIATATARAPRSRDRASPDPVSKLRTWPFTSKNPGLATLSTLAGRRARDRATTVATARAREVGSRRAERDPPRPDARARRRCSLWPAAPRRLRRLVRRRGTRRATRKRGRRAPAPRSSSSRTRPRSSRRATARVLARRSATPAFTSPNQVYGHERRRADADERAHRADLRRDGSATAPSQPFSVSFVGNTINVPAELRARPDSPASRRVVRAAPSHGHRQQHRWKLDAVLGRRGRRSARSPSASSTASSTANSVTSRRPGARRSAARATTG